MLHYNADGSVSQGFVPEVAGEGVSLTNPLGVTLNGFQDHYGTQIYFAPNGELVAMPLYKLLGDVFAGSMLDTEMWTIAEGAGGNVAVTAGELVVQTGTTANNSVSITSSQVARFIGLNPNKERILIQLPDSGVVNNARSWGMGDALNRAYFTMDGTTFKCVTRKGGVDTVVADGSAEKPFNGQYENAFVPGLGSRFYEAIIQPRQVVFIADQRIVHTHNSANETWTETMHLPIFMESINSNGLAQNVTFKSRLAVVARFGIADAQTSSVFQEGQTAAGGRLVKVGPGDLHGLVISAVANNANVTVWNNTSAAGSVKFSTGNMPAQTAPLALPLGGTSFSVGCTLSITGANANAYLEYD